MKNKIKAVINNVKGNAVRFVNDKSGASALFDIAIGIVVACLLGGIVIAVVNGWAQTWFTNLLNTAASKISV
jgi:hypothetical protein